MKLDLLSQILAAGLPEPEPEYRFAAPERQFRFDFAWPDACPPLACEVDGATWNGKGRHVRGAGVERDCHKYSLAAAMGWRIVRVTTGMVNDGSALAYLRRALAYEVKS